MNDDSTTPVTVGLIIIVAACIAATILLLPLDDGERYEPADTTPPTPAPAPTVWQTTNLPAPLTTEAAVVTVAAARGPAIQVSEPPPAPTTTQLVFADDCAEMKWYRQQAGLPERFDGIGWRESNCRNEDGVRTFCCYGWWQNYISSHLSRQSLYREPIIAWCGVTSADDINSDTPDDKWRQACVTKVVFDISGYSPWKATA